MKRYWLKARILCAVGILSVSGAAGQSSAPGIKQIPDVGLQNAWDVRKTIASVQRDTADLRPLLAQLSPQKWADEKGAPTTYIIQWQAAQQQLNDAVNVATLFAQKPDSLSKGLDMYFRLEALETTERALAEGAQRYDSRTNAAKLSLMIAHNFADREGLREYLSELATSTEQNFKVADQEAQRCRGAIIQQDLPPSSRKTRKN